MTPRTSHERKKENHARAKYVAAANRGWMSVKTLPPADQVKCFYLTSPFIEPAVALTELRPLMTGGAGLMVNAAGADVPSAVVTVTLAVQEFTMRLAGTEAINCVGLT